MEAVETTSQENVLPQAENIVKNYMLWSMGVGLVPIPVVDFAGVTGLQLNMVYKLCKLYDVPFSRNWGKTVISTLLGGVLPTSFARTIASLVKLAPLVGQAAGARTMPAVSGASTFALGKVFIQHFESGGAFLDFEPEKVKGPYLKRVKRSLKEPTEIHDHLFGLLLILTPFIESIWFCHETAPQ